MPQLWFKYFSSHLCASRELHLSKPFASQVYPRGTVRSRVAAFERQYPLLKTISKPSWINVDRQRSTTDAVLSWLNAGRRSTSTVAGQDTLAGAIQTFEMKKLLTWSYN